MEIPGFNKVGDAIGNAFCVFDFSFIISGAVTVGFIVLDMHYYGHDVILQMGGWKSIVVWVIAVSISIFAHSNCFSNIRIKSTFLLR